MVLLCLYKYLKNYAIYGETVSIQKCVPKVLFLQCDSSLAGYWFGFIVMSAQLVDVLCRRKMGVAT